MAFYLTGSVTCSSLHGSECAPEDAYFQDIPTVITPSRIPQKPWLSPATVEVVNAETLEKWGVRDVSDVLRRVAGVDVRKAGWITLVGPRGTANTHMITQILVLLDGIPVLDPLLGRFELSINFPIDMVKQVEIVRGAGSSLYGANAFAGVINIITKSGTDQPEHRFRQEIGPDNTLRTNLRFSHPSPECEWFCGWRGNFTDGRDGHAVNDNDEMLDRDYYAKIGKGKGEVFAYASRLNQGRPLNEQDADPVDAVTNDNLFLRSSYHFFDEPGRNLSLDLYQNNQDGTYPGGGAPGRPPRIEFDRRRQGAKLEFTQQRKRRTFVAGTEYAEKEVDYLDIGGIHSSHESAFYLQGEFRSSSDWTFTLGGRFDDDSVYGSNFSPRLSALRKLSENRTFRFSAGRAYRAPNFSQQYIDTFIGTRGFDLNSDGTDDVFLPIRAIGNPQLDSEKMDNFEVAFSNNVNSQLRFDVVFYVKKSKERFGSEITFGPTEALARTINEGKATSIGVEISSRWDLSQRARINFNYTLQNTEDDETKEELSYAPRHKGNLGLEYSFDKRWFAYFNVHAMSEKRGEVTPELSGFGFVDLRVGKKIKNGSIALNGYNVFDKDYYETELYPMPGRTVLIELLKRF